MSDEFKPGDVVEMKTASPKMIFVGESNLGEALCEWFDPQDRKTKREVISFSSLKKSTS